MPPLHQLHGNFFEPSRPRCQPHGPHPLRVQCAFSQLIRPRAKSRWILARLLARVMQRVPSDPPPVSPETRSRRRDYRAAFPLPGASRRRLRIHHSKVGGTIFRRAFTTRRIERSAGSAPIAPASLLPPRHLAMQKRPRRAPPLLDRRRRNPQHLGRLLHRKPPEESQFHQPRLLRIQHRQLL